MEPYSIDLRTKTVKSVRSGVYNSETPFASVASESTREKERLRSSSQRYLPIGLGSVAHKFCGLGAITHTEELVDNTQVLLHSGFGEEEAFGYLSVRQPLADELQNFPLAGGENVETHGFFIRN